MKHLLLASLLLLPVASQAQAPTTQEEYNYATKGLTIMRASGLDLKTGYVLAEKRTTTGGDGKVTVVTESLIRKSDNSLAVTVFEINAPQFESTFYLGLPNATASREIWTQYFNQADVLFRSNQFAFRIFAGDLARRLSEISSVMKR